MSFNDKRQFMDIAIIKIGKDCADESTKKSGNSFLHIVIAVLATIVFIGIGYLACVRVGLLPPPSSACCVGVLELDFGFEFPSTDA